MTKRASFRRSWIAWLGIMILALSATVPAALGAAPPSADLNLLNELQAKPGQASYLVFLNVQADLSAAEALPSRAARGQYVYQALRTVAEQSQAGLRADLEAWGVPYRPFFIVNAVQVTGNEALAQRLTARPDVARVVSDPTFEGLDDPPPGSPGPAAVDAHRRCSLFPTTTSPFVPRSTRIAMCRDRPTGVASSPARTSEPTNPPMHGRNSTSA